MPIYHTIFFMNNPDVFEKNKRIVSGTVRFTEEIRYNQGYHRVNPLMIGGNAYLKNSLKIHIVHILFTHL